MKRMVLVLCITSVCSCAQTKLYGPFHEQPINNAKEDDPVRKSYSGSIEIHKNGLRRLGTSKVYYNDRKIAQVYIRSSLKLYFNAGIYVLKYRKKASDQDTIRFGQQGVERWRHDLFSIPMAVNITSLGKTCIFIN